MLGLLLAATSDVARHRVAVLRHSLAQISQTWLDKTRGSVSDDGSCCVSSPDCLWAIMANRCTVQMGISLFSFFFFPQTFEINFQSVHWGFEKNALMIQATRTFKACLLWCDLMPVLTHKVQHAPPCTRWSGRLASPFIDDYGHNCSFNESTGVAKKSHSQIRELIMMSYYIRH